MTQLRVLVCGSRDYTDRRKIYEELDKLSQSHELVIIEGGQVSTDPAEKHLPWREREKWGADYFASEWARDHALDHKKFPANWKRYGRAAGPIRNRQMLEQGFPDVVLAFGGKDGTGTNDMVRISKKAGLEVKEFDRD